MSYKSKYILDYLKAGGALPKAQTGYEFLTDMQMRDNAEYGRLPESAYQPVAPRDAWGDKSDFVFSDLTQAVKRGEINQSQFDAIYNEWLRLGKPDIRYSQNSLMGEAAALLGSGKTDSGRYRPYTTVLTPNIIWIDRDAPPETMLSDIANEFLHAKQGDDNNTIFNHFMNGILADGIAQRVPGFITDVVSGTLDFIGLDDAAEWTDENVSPWFDPYNKTWTLEGGHMVEGNPDHEYLKNLMLEADIYDDQFIYNPETWKYEKNKNIDIIRESKEKSVKDDFTKPNPHEYGTDAYWDWKKRKRQDTLYKQLGGTVGIPLFHTQDKHEIYGGMFAPGSKFSDAAVSLLGNLGLADKMGYSDYWVDTANKEFWDEQRKNIGKEINFGITDRRNAEKVLLTQEKFDDLYNKWLETGAYPINLWEKGSSKLQFNTRPNFQPTPIGPNWGGIGYNLWEEDPLYQLIAELSHAYQRKHEYGEDMPVGQKGDYNMAGALTMFGAGFKDLIEDWTGGKYRYDRKDALEGVHKHGHSDYNERDYWKWFRSVDESFNEAFEKAEANNQKTFTWKGNEYAVEHPSDDSIEEYDPASRDEYEYIPPRKYGGLIPKMQSGGMIPPTSSTTWLDIFKSPNPLEKLENKLMNKVGHNTALGNEYAHELLETKYKDKYINEWNNMSKKEQEEWKNSEAGAWAKKNMQAEGIPWKEQSDAENYWTSWMLDNTVWDDYNHAIQSYLLAQNVGPGMAKLYSGAHELNNLYEGISSGNTPETIGDSGTDMRNNLMGINAFKEGLSIEEFMKQLIDEGAYREHYSGPYEDRTWKDVFKDMFQPVKLKKEGGEFYIPKAQGGFEVLQNQQAYNMTHGNTPKINPGSNSSNENTTEWSFDSIVNPTGDNNPSNEIITDSNLDPCAEIRRKLDTALPGDIPALKEQLKTCENPSEKLENDPNDPNNPDNPNAPDPNYDLDGDGVLTDKEVWASNKDGVQEKWGSFEEYKRNADCYRKTGKNCDEESVNDDGTPNNDDQVVTDGKVECQQCDPGTQAPIANLFDGTECPAGWEPMSDIDPCSGTKKEEDASTEVEDFEKVKPGWHSPDIYSIHPGIDETALGALAGWVHGAGVDFGLWDPGFQRGEEIEEEVETQELEEDAKSNEISDLEIKDEIIEEEDKSETSNEVDENEVVDDGEGSFDEAFAKARDELGAGQTFTWNGKEYTTWYEGEEEAITGGDDDDGVTPGENISNYNQQMEELWNDPNGDSVFWTDDMREEHHNRHFHPDGTPKTQDEKDIEAAEREKENQKYMYQDPEDGQWYTQHPNMYDDNNELLPQYQQQRFGGITGNNIRFGGEGYLPKAQYGMDKSDYSEQIRLLNMQNNADNPTISNNVLTSDVYNENNLFNTIPQKNLILGSEGDHIFDNIDFENTSANNQNIEESADVNASSGDIFGGSGNVDFDHSNRKEQWRGFTDIFRSKENKKSIKNQNVNNETVNENTIPDLTPEGGWPNDIVADNLGLETNFSDIEDAGNTSDFNYQPFNPDEPQPIQNAIIGADGNIIDTGGDDATLNLESSNVINDQENILTDDQENILTDDQENISTDDDFNLDNFEELELEDEVEVGECLCNPELDEDDPNCPEFPDCNPVNVVEDEIVMCQQCDPDTNAPIGVPPNDDGTCPPGTTPDDGTNPCEGIDVEAEVDTEEKKKKRKLDEDVHRNPFRALVQAGQKGKFIARQRADKKFQQARVHRTTSDALYADDATYATNQGVGRPDANVTEFYGKYGVEVDDDLLGELIAAGADIEIL